MKEKEQAIGGCSEPSAHGARHLVPSLAVAARASTAASMALGAKTEAVVAAKKVFTRKVGRAAGGPRAAAPGRLPLMPPRRF